MENEKITERQAANLIGVNPASVMNWRKKGLIPLEYEVKKIPNGCMRIFYEKNTFLEWAKTL